MLAKSGKSFKTNKLSSTFLSDTINSHVSDISTEVAERSDQSDLSIFENQINDGYL